MDAKASERVIEFHLEFESGGHLQEINGMEMLPMPKFERRERQSRRMPHFLGAGEICEDRAPAHRSPMTLTSL